MSQFGNELFGAEWYARMENHRALWSAVVTQALHDIQTLEIDSIDYDQAVCFLTGGQDWAVSRQSIADLVDLHTDDLKRMGLRAIRKRRLDAGLPENPPPIVRAVIAEPLQWELEPVAPTRAKSRRTGGGKWTYNPFNPLLRPRAA